MAPVALEAYCQDFNIDNELVVAIGVSMAIVIVIHTLVTIDTACGVDMRSRGSKKIGLATIFECLW